ncbi:MAG: BLUF domain-containing protein, partial [Halieaceae bacterium]
MTANDDLHHLDPPDELVHLAYVSTQTGEMSARDLLDLLTKAQRTNTEREITGLLLHKNRSYFQVLEGARADVDA